MSLEWKSGPLAEGLKCYRSRQFFMAHEHWEEVWRVLQPPEKTFLQALIQVAVAFHHFERHNRLGAESMLKSALRRLEPFPQEFEGFSLVCLRENIATWLDVLASGESSPNLTYPDL